MREVCANRGWKPLELLEFEAVFGLIESIDERTSVNRSKSAEISINSRFTMGKPFRCEHRGSDRCVPHTARRRTDGRPTARVAGTLSVSHPRTRGGFADSQCQSVRQVNRSDAGKRTKSSKSGLRDSAGRLPPRCRPLASQGLAGTPDRGTGVPKRVDRGASGGETPAGDPTRGRVRAWRAPARRHSAIHPRSRKRRKPSSRSSRPRPAGRTRTSPHPVAG